MKTLHIEFAATCGHRLASIKLENECPSTLAKTLKEPIQLVIPSKALTELLKMLEKHKGNVAVKCDRAQIIFSIPGHRLTSRLLEGQYPNYRQLIPKDFVRLVTCDRRSLVSSLERIAVLADQKNNLAKLEFSASDQAVVLSVESADVGSGREELPVVMSGEDLAIAFNVRYLLDGLKAISTPEVQMQFNTATSPAVFSPVDGLKMTYLAMPCQTRA